MRNHYEIRGGFTVIHLNRQDGLHLETLIDTEDLSKVEQYPKWYAAYDKETKGYYVKCITVQHGKTVCWPLHRVIMNTPTGMQTDHLNHDTLDNRKENLRNVTMAQNLQNIVVRSSTTGIRGVCWSKNHQKWMAKLKRNGKMITVGFFDDIEEAARKVQKVRAIFLPYSLDAMGANSHDDLSPENISRLRAWQQEQLRDSTRTPRKEVEARAARNRQKAFELYRQGLNYRQIGERLGYTDKWAYMAIRQLSKNEVLVESR